MGDSPANKQDVQQLQQTQQEPDSPIQAVSKALGQNFDGLRDQYGGLVAAVGPVMKLIQAYVDKGEFTDAAGNVTKFPVGAWRNPQGLGESWVQAQDAKALEGVHAVLKREKEDLVNRILTGYYKARKFSDAAIQQKLASNSAEKLAVQAMLFMQGHGQALKMLSDEMRREGINSTDMGASYTRAQQARINVLAQMYRTATDLSSNNPLQGATMSKHMQTLTEAYQSGAFQPLFRTPGVFDSSGRFTRYGQALAESQLNTFGRNLAMAKLATGIKDPVELMSVMKPLFGNKIAAQFADPNTGRALAAYHHAAQAAGLTTVQGLQMLRAAHDVTGSSNLARLTSLATQKLGFDKLALMSEYGDVKQWNDLTMRNVLQAATGTGMKQSAAAAAALTEKYGRSAAWNMMDTIIQKGSHYRNGILAEASKFLGKRLSANDVQALLWSPEAKAYEDSGRAMPALTTIGTVKYWNYLKSRSPWFAKNAGRVLQEQGELTTNAISRYLQSHKVDATTAGKVLKHVNSFGAHLGTDTDSLLSFIGIGAKHGQRMQLMKESERQGEDSYKLAHLQGRAGLEGMLSEAMEPDATFGSIFGGALGQGRKLDSSDIPASTSRINGVKNTFTLDNAPEPPATEDLAKTAPKKIETAPGMTKTPNM